MSFAGQPLPSASLFNSRTCPSRILVGWGNFVTHSCAYRVETDVDAVSLGPYSRFIALVTCKNTCTPVPPGGRGRTAALRAPFFWRVLFSRSCVAKV